jgi:hypothetical protein
MRELKAFIFGLMTVIGTFVFTSSARAQTPAIVQTIPQTQPLVYLTSSEAGEDLYVDRTSLKTIPPDAYRNFPAVRLWAVNEVKGGRRTPGRTERYLFSFNCAAHTVNILSYQNNRSGTKLQDWRAADLAQKYEAPKPGTMAETAMAFACSGGKMPIAPATVANPDGSDTIEIDGGSEEVPL